MTKRMRIAALSLTLIAAAGCQDLNEVPVDFVAPEIFYKTGTDAVAAVNAAYNSFVTPSNGISSSNYLGRNFFMLVEYPTDYTTSRLSAGNERSLIGNFSPLFTPSHAYIEGYWQAAYSGINKANAVITNVPSIEVTPLFPQTRKDQVIGEAKFLRALHYYWLAGMFGGVPLRLTQTTPENVNEATPRASAEETWAQIQKDLTEAAAVLPNSWPSSDFGRATKYGALTLLAKSYLQSAATVPSLHGNYQKAYDTFKQITGFSLDPNYRSLFDGTNEHSSEIIWSIQNIRVDGYGGRITEWYSPITDPETFQAGGQNQFQAERPFYDSYEAGDIRKDGTWMTSFTRSDGKTVTWAWTSGIEKNTAYGSTGTTPRKYVDWAAPDGGSEGIDYAILRYADVLLGTAEAINGSSGPSAEAIGDVNQVRARAGLGPLPAASTASQTAFADAISNEREREFAMEGVHGVFDMRRNWDWAKTRVEASMALARKPGPDIDGPKPFTSSVEKCTDSNKAVCYTPIDDKWKLYPIPAHAIQLNPALTQNPGW